MAQPVGQLFEYLGGAHIKDGTTITTDNPLIPAGTNCVIYKSEKGKASVNGMDAFTVKYGEVSYFAASPVHTYTFIGDCDVAFAKVVAVPI